ncbi:MAG: MOSC domain-containing protein [Mycobacterium sp.]
MQVRLVLSVNVARRCSDDSAPATGIDKRSTLGSVAIRAPGGRCGRFGSGVDGDVIGNPRLHGGDDQAVYAYAREDLDAWESKLNRLLSNGMFGENLTTAGIDVSGAVIGERWRVGSGGVVLEVTRPRTPCRTFANFLGIAGWIDTFAQASAPGAYLRVIEPGHVRAGDSVSILDRPDHGVTIRRVFRAMMSEPELLPGILAAEALADAVKELALRRLLRSGVSRPSKAPPGR